MICERPFTGGTIPFGCGACVPCRVARARQWATRQFLESLCHQENCFVTLTYNQDNYPRDGSLQPKHLQDFLKRLRRYLEPRGVRYFAVGEYGTRSQRAHYHLNLFGMRAHSDAVGCNPDGMLLRKAWGLGFVDAREFNQAKARYISGYVIKHLTRKDDLRLNGLHPEFARMSLKPPIGDPAMAVIAKSIADVLDGGDVPRSIKIGSQNVYLGRTMIRKLRFYAGMSDEEVQKAKDKISMARSVELLPVLMASIKAEASFSDAYVESVEARINQVKARQKLYQKGETI